jgi:glycosyltransferase involved in cell wall biosynthesis
MKVCFYLCDQARTRKSRGIWVYTSELISSLVNLNRTEIITLTSRDGPNFDGVENVVLPLKTASVPVRLITDHVHACLLPDADIYHYPKGFLPFYRCRKEPHIASILDTIGVHYYDNYRGKNSVFRPFELEYWLAVLDRTLRQVDAVITISHTSAESIRCHCNRRRIKPPPIFVTHLASKYREVPPEARQKESYVIHLASELPHKRTGWLLYTWKCMESAGKDLPELRLVGSLDKEQQEMAEAMKSVRVFTHQTEDQLKAMIMGARALIYPSEIEGFGMPALEAYLLGTPAMYVAETSVEEILRLDGENVPGRFIFDIDDFGRALNEVLDISSEKLQNCQRRLSEKFTWEKTAMQTLKAYETVLGRPP